MPALFFLSLSLRLICLSQAQDTPLFGFFARDSVQYDAIAVEMLNGRLDAPDANYFNAVYPLFLTLVYFLFGHNPGSVFLVQVVMSAVTTVLVYLLGAKLTHRTSVGVLAALLFAGYDLSIFFTVVLLDTTLSALLIVSLVLSLAYAAEGRRPAWWFLAGALFGVSLALRPNVALFLPFLLVWIAARGDVPGSPKRKAIAYLCLGAVLALAPFSARRYAVDREFSPFPGSGGLNFYIGNNPEATGTFVSLEHLNISVAPGDLIRQSVVEAERRTGKELSVSEASSFWFREGLRFVRDNPSRFLTLSLKKTLLFWNGNEGEPNVNFSFSRRFLPILALPLFSFAIISPLALTGLALALWRRAAGFSLIVAFVLAYMLSLALLFMAARYRFPCVPVIAIFAAYALDSLFRALRSGKTGEIAAIAVLCAVFALAATAPIPGMQDPENFSVARFNLGNLYLEKGLLDEAAREYREIAPTDPNYPRSRYNLGLVYERKGMPDEAIAEYRNVLARKPDFAKAHNNLGLLYFKKGLKEEAFGHYRQALAIDPDSDEALVNVSWYFRDKGMMNEAYEACRKALAANPDNAVANYDMAVFSYQRGDFRKAADHYRRATISGYRENPAFREALEAQLPDLAL